MKKYALSLLLTLPLSASWFTGTSASFGAKYFKDLGTMDIKLEQYFINSSMPKLYMKAGYYREQLAHWPLNDGSYTVADTGSNLLVGTGYNLLTLGNFFIDGGASIGYRLSTTTEPTTITLNGTTYDVNSLYTDSAITPFFDLGIGMAFGKFTVRADLTMAAEGTVELVQTSDDTVLQAETGYNRLHANIGVAYWY